ncbi:uncharacterized protein PHALS_14739 [Plasmopara halstedii]|uniref:Uncharacterized protein n=1 Tax=Plasmopara halstedii TaxID=4781 RepID=A0A0P1ARW7_PLAHL|nr:uncharacterized protein PHALS_14739 [Plasmopara halstedii]CEG43677.1 hypothetical protein PHALS_14739 [Plasmopara halstedii]|eukprot:XP_024580046.1 hypothetical protein PHALS_14739 [Plasmopara halstedii]
MFIDRYGFAFSEGATVRCSDKNSSEVAKKPIRAQNATAYRVCGRDKTFSKHLFKLDIILSKSGLKKKRKFLIDI